MTFALLVCASHFCSHLTLQVKYNYNNRNRWEGFPLWNYDPDLYNGRSNRNLLSSNFTGDLKATSPLMEIESGTGSRRELNPLAVFLGWIGFTVVRPMVMKAAASALGNQIYGFLAFTGMSTTAATVGYFQSGTAEIVDLSIQIKGTIPESLRAVVGPVAVPWTQAQNGRVVDPNDESENTPREVFTSPQTYQTSAVILREATPRCTRVDTEVCPI